jgi:methylglutaconyl-CoA hydratase
LLSADSDLKEVGPAATASSADEFTEILRTMMASPKPVVAQVEGAARAGGLGLIAASDVAIAARNVTFALSEVRRGLVAAVISVPLVPRMTPRGARELFLTGETFGADRAVAVGLLTRVVAAGAVRAEVDQCTAQLIQGAPGAVAATKQLLASAELAELNEKFAHMATLSAHHFASVEGKEGVASFVEKRPPAWVATSGGSR